MLSARHSPPLQLSSMSPSFTSFKRRLPKLVAAFPKTTAPAHCQEDPNFSCRILVTLPKIILGKEESLYALRKYPPTHPYTQGLQNRVPGPWARKENAISTLTTSPVKTPSSCPCSRKLPCLSHHSALGPDSLQTLTAWV